MIKIKNALFLILSILVILSISLNFDRIWERLSNLNTPKQTIEIKEANEYQKNDTFYFVKQTDNYTPNNFNDLMNIFYSILNQGWDEFTFYCPVEYSECLKDVVKLSYDEVLLSDINNFVHPYNSYSKIKILYDDSGEVTVKINHQYSEEEITLIDKDIDSLIASQTTDEMSTKEKIKALHDYIINETKYDTKRASKEESEYDSARINGVLYDHYAICSGYTDTMAVILTKLNVPNFKVASATHVWNAVYIDNTWLHLDLTWDDPVTASGKDILDHSYFLITNERLEELDKTNLNEHVFNKSTYYELTY